MRFIRCLGSVINVDQIVHAQYSTAGNAPELAITMTAGRVLTVSGDTAVELMAVLCERCEANIGPDLSLFKPADLQKPSEAGHTKYRDGGISEWS